MISVDLSDFNGPTLNGAVDGNPVVLKVYDVSEGIVINTEPTITTGGEFGDLFTVVSELELGDGPDPIYGCTDESACNYDSDANTDDGSCDYAEDNFDCDGNCLVDTDCAGECGGDAEDLGCGCNEGTPDEDGCCGTTADCSGECGGDAVVDDCGVCDGDGESCAVYVELEVTTTVDESVLDDMDAFEDDFCSLIETELDLPDGSCEVTDVTILDTRLSLHPLVYLKSLHLSPRKIHLEDQALSL
jgi:hypothetical protein